MNKSNKLNDAIKSAKSLAAEYEEIAQRDLNDFSAQLTAQSMQYHVADLQKQINTAKSFSEREVLEVRLLGNATQNGDISLVFIGKLVEYLSGALHIASQNLKTPNRKKRVLKETMNSLDLRLANMSYGSTRLFITGKANNDLFGYSIIEEALTQIFSLLNANNPDELIDSVSKIGVKATAKVNSFLHELSVSNTELELSWFAANNNKSNIKISKNRIEELTSTIENLVTEPSEQFKTIGTVITLSSKGNFEILADDGSVFKGHFGMDLLEKIQEMHIGDKVNVIIERQKFVNQITKAEKLKYRLKAIYR